MITKINTVILQNKRYLALGVACFFIIIFAIKALYSNKHAAPPVTSLPKVLVSKSSAISETIKIRLSGTSKASRTINLLSEVTGQIYKVEKQKGSIVNTGDTVATIQMDDRSQQLKEAVAGYNLAKEQLEITKKLTEKEFRSDVDLKSQQVQFEAAASKLAKVEKEIANTKIKAPSKGVLANLPLDEGSFISPGTLVATLANLDPILIQAYVSEKDYASIQKEKKAEIEFIDGQKTTGVVSFISSLADSKTHMFAIEISIENPDFKIPEGITARIHIPTAFKKIHKVNPSVLAVNDQGSMVIKTLNNDNIVEEYVVDIIQSEKDQLLVSGLPDELTIITYGGNFVTVGDKAEGSTEK
jgi:multidrug efflux system membrane fusion protein